MARPYQITYFGTYEANYPRNRLFITKLREQGVRVTTCHASLWEGIEHKVSIAKDPRQLLWLAWRVLRNYILLGWKLCACHRKANEIMVGYIGQLDVLFAWPLTRIMRQKLSFNALISLYDTLVSDRGTFKPNSLAARALWLLDWLAFRAADEVIIDTQAHKKFIADEFGVNASRIRVVPIDAEKQFRPLPIPRRPEDRDRFVVLFLGKFIALQGIDKILHAMRLIQQQGNDRIFLRIVGDGQLFDEMRTLAETLALIHVEWDGWTPYEAMPTVINQADLCLGIFGDSGKATRVVPNKVWQCLRCGKTVITRTMAVPEEHPLFTNLIFVEPTPEAIAEAIQRVASGATAVRAQQANTE